MVKDCCALQAPQLQRLQQARAACYVFLPIRGQQMTAVIIDRNSTCLQWNYRAAQSQQLKSSKNYLKIQEIFLTCMFGEATFMQ